MRRPYPLLIALFLQTSCSLDDLTRAIKGPDAFKPPPASETLADVGPVASPLTSVPQRPTTYFPAISQGVELTGSVAWMELPKEFSGKGEGSTTPKFFLKRGLVRFKLIETEGKHLSMQLRNEVGAVVGPFLIVYGPDSEQLEWAISTDGNYDWIVNKGEGSWTLKVLTWRELCVDAISAHRAKSSDCDGSGTKGYVGALE